MVFQEEIPYGVLFLDLTICICTQFYGVGWVTLLMYIYSRTVQFANSCVMRYITILTVQKTRQ